MKLIKVIPIILILNFILIFFSIRDGLNKKDITLRFQERQTVTFFSALLLGFTGIISLIIYSLRKKLSPTDKGFNFWLFSSLGFFYLCIDEYFMAHEGIDNFVFSLFRESNQKLHLDGLVLGFFGLVALVICFLYRKELLRKREILPYLFLGGFCFLGMVTFDLLYSSLRDIGILIEESFKILGVSFIFAGYILNLFSYIQKIFLRTDKISTA